MNKQNFVGVDTHKDTLACYKQGDFKEFKTTQKGFQEALRWAGKAKWAVEGAYCFGRPFSAFLIKNGIDVYEVNPLLTKTWRGTLAVSNPKNDYGDAKVISLFAENSNLQKVSLETIHLKEKITARDSMVKQKTEITNSLKMLFLNRGEEVPFKEFTTQKAIKWFENNADIIIKTKVRILKKILLGIIELEEEIKRTLPEKAVKLKQLKGVSDITAAIIYTETKGKLYTAAKLASYAGISPVEKSSGRTSRHRNNKSGNRILNSVFYRLSLAQSRYDEKGKAYFERKMSEGKSKRHARKCLSRQLCSIVFKLLND
jgi:transposase